MSTTIHDPVAHLCQLAHEELPLLELVRAVVTGTRAGSEHSDQASSLSVTVQDMRGYVRKSLINEELQGVAESNPGLNGRLVRNEGALHHAEISSDSFVITPKLLRSRNDPIPSAGYRQALALEMPLFANKIKDAYTGRFYLVLTYCMSELSDAPAWIALQDPSRLVVIDLSEELHHVLEEGFPTYPDSGEADFEEQPIDPSSPQLKLPNVLQSDA